MNLPLAPTNPFRPGAGQTPVYLAGRAKEQDEFRAMLRQSPVTQNAILTGLRGVGKTVLLETFKPAAQGEGWLWTGNDLSESVSLTEERVARRLVVDLATLLGPLVIQTQQSLPFGFTKQAQSEERPLSFDDLWGTYERTPGLTIDKLQAVFSQVSAVISSSSIRGIIFAYDEAQNLTDHAADKEYPLSLLLDLFSSLQRKHTNKYFMLVLTGLPTLFPRLNEARTYTERMFHVIQIDSLNEEDAREAIVQPPNIAGSPIRFEDSVVDQIVEMSGGYPYLIQFICKEVFDAWITRIADGKVPSVPAAEILEKLDQDFFAPRWQNATDRQQQLMQVVATLPNKNQEFTAPDIVKASGELLRNPFTSSHVVQILKVLAERGLIYRTRRGSYCFAVPLLADFIARQTWNPESLRTPA